MFSSVSRRNCRCWVNPQMCKEEVHCLLQGVDYLEYLDQAVCSSKPLLVCCSLFYGRGLGLGSGVGDRVSGRFGAGLLDQWSSEIDVVGDRSR